MAKMTAGKVNGSRERNNVEAVATALAVATASVPLRSRLPLHVVAQRTKALFSDSFQCTIRFCTGKTPDE